MWSNLYVFQNVTISLEGIIFLFTNNEQTTQTQIHKTFQFELG